MSPLLSDQVFDRLTIVTTPFDHVSRMAVYDGSFGPHDAPKVNRILSGSRARAVTSWATFAATEMGRKGSLNPRLSQISYSASSSSRRNLLSFLPSAWSFKPLIRLIASCFISSGDDPHGSPFVA